MYFSLRKRAYRLDIVVICLLAGFLVGSINFGLLLSEGDADLFRLSRADMSGGRLGIWQVSWEILKENYLQSIGFGRYEQYYHEYRAMLYRNNGLIYILATNHPHNELMLWAIEGGIIPAAGVIIYILYNIGRTVKKGKVVYPYAVLLIPLIIHSLLEYPFCQSILHFFLFLTLLFLLESRIGETVDVKFE
jgi:O-antigen polymerase